MRFCVSVEASDRAAGHATTHYRHAECVSAKVLTNALTSVDSSKIEDLEGFEQLTAGDQTLFRNHAASMQKAAQAKEQEKADAEAEKEARKREKEEAKFAKAAAKAAAKAEKAAAREAKAKEKSGAPREKRPRGAVKEAVVEGVSEGEPEAAEEKEEAPPKVWSSIHPPLRRASLMTN